MSDDGIVTLIPRAEREKQQSMDEAHAEALAMLDKAKALIQERGGRVTGLAIAITFEDGCYGRLVPVAPHSMAALIGAIGTMHHDLILRTLIP